MQIGSIIAYLPVDSKALEGHNLICVVFVFVLSTEKFRFKSWMVQHKKKYSAEEYHRRQQVFVSNWRKINAHNARNHTFKMALNQFSDMTFDEIKRTVLWSQPQNCSATKGNYLRGTGPYPTSVDWRKNMQAEQQLVDCAQDFNNHGCEGGLPSQAFEYILYNKGIMAEDAYPYQGRDGVCKFQPKQAVAFVKEVANITLNDEEAMVEAVALYNPVSFAFEVTDGFLSYRKGIYSRYFLIQRGKNMCGLAACASYPIPRV
ncbi:pro-cathepsin H [Echinops telfairi]|uniref:Pro-cathepsin H n=1 Tax=Echinops telfairi TaxID=9371 RepID=A0AC55CRX3_ECHTE|nr:pro-cathepsin H [Echinops telfairi]